MSVELPYHLSPIVEPMRRSSSSSYSSDQLGSARPDQSVRANEVPQTSSAATAATSDDEEEEQFVKDMLR